ncbi:transmembrane protein 26-like [Rhinophrynus dorsalis]
MGILELQAEIKSAPAIESRPMLEGEVLEVTEKMCKRVCSAKKIVLAIISRLVFTAHGVLLVYRVVEVKKDNNYWMLLIGLLLLSLEMAVTLTVTEKGEWKWFSPMVFLYLCSAIPSVVLLELDYIEARHLMSNSTLPDSPEDLVKEMNFPQSSQWLNTLEQIMILVLVIGRWLMPKGEMSREQLSQLLLIYIGLGADILEMLLLITELAFQTNYYVTIVGLSLFSWALLQFTLVLTQTQSSESHRKTSDDISDGDNKSCVPSCCTNEVWSLIITVGMQDGPFLIYRLYIMIKEKILNNMMIFFICKNIMTVAVEIYRIAVIQCAGKHRDKD